MGCLQLSQVPVEETVAEIQTRTTAQFFQLEVLGLRSPRFFAVQKKNWMELFEDEKKSFGSVFLYWFLFCVNCK